ncbi:MAG: hypothetical protein RLZZ243_1567 [Bacteroidota bacterium]|jgi:hypothetical protein
MRVLLYLVLVGLLSACIKNNPNPSWIKVNPFVLVANPSLSGSEGQLSQDIRDVWLYIDDQMIGCFQTPFKIPILKDGNVNIKIYPAVRNNGIASDKKIYPFMNVYEINSKLVKDQTLTVNPVTNYVDNLNFWIEDFEDASIKIQDDPNTSMASLFVSSDNLTPFNGFNYGKVVLTETDSVWVANTTEQLSIPKNKPCFIEVDYFNTNTFVQGFLALSLNGNFYQDNAGFNEQTFNAVKWKKMYIELTELIGNSINGSNFVQTFKANLDSLQTETFICIDNIKIVYK